MVVRRVWLMWSRSGDGPDEPTCLDNHCKYLISSRDSCSCKIATTLCPPIRVILSWLMIPALYERSSKSHSRSLSSAPCIAPLFFNNDWSSSSSRVRIHISPHSHCSFFSPSLCAIHGNLQTRISVCFRTSIRVIECWRRSRKSLLRPRTFVLTPLNSPSPSPELLKTPTLRIMSRMVIKIAKPDKFSRMDQTRGMFHTTLPSS